MKEESDHKHYVVSEDLYPIMKKWGDERAFVVPSSQWFAKNHHLLRGQLESSLNTPDKEEVVIVDSLPYHYIAQEIQQIVYKLHSDRNFSIDLGSVISLDKIYPMEMSCPCFTLEINRTVNENGKELGNSERPGCPPLEQQIESFKRSITSREVMVVDDGIWTGHSMHLVVDALDKKGIEVVAIVVGVYHKEAGKLLDFGLSQGKIFAVQTYNYTRPIYDWVCERDYFLGVPFGGRTVVFNADSQNLNQLKGLSTGACYTSNAEWLKSWASIEDADGRFRKFCHQRSLVLFKEIEVLSGKNVLLRDLSRIPLSFLESGATPEDSVTALIEQEVNKL